MPRNVYFSQGATSEKRLYEDITIEALKIYGHDVFYIPRSIVNTDSIFNEDALSKFGEAFQMSVFIGYQKMKALYLIALIVQDVKKKLNGMIIFL